MLESVSHPAEAWTAEAKKAVRLPFADTEGLDEARRGRIGSSSNGVIRRPSWNDLVVMGRPDRRTAR